MYKYFNALTRNPWKPSDSKKKENGGSYSTMHTKRHFQGACNEEGRASALHILQRSKDRDAKHDEESAEKVG